MTIRASGFTFLRNAVKLDYPAVESIRSVLPIVDEFIVNIGPSDDGTEDLVRSINDPKIKIIHSQWNPNLVQGGYIYAQQTNIALFNCMGKWAFYIQADEVVHDKDLPVLDELMKKCEDDDRIEGLALNELTFWGDYNTIINVYPWRYGHRCWIVKPHKFVLSRGDASGFTVHPKYKERGRRIRVVDSGARVFHYSFIKPLSALAEKYKTVFNYWSDQLEKKQAEELTRSYYKSWFPRQFIGRYEGNHPSVMQKRIEQYPIKLDLNSPEWRTKLSWYERKKLIQTWLIRRLGDQWFTQSYKLVRI
ncbi:MAG TPA: hypothetical protein PLW02_07280 [Verrucomicrobiota bacterium]|nr:hypothetical protein [Verrucomicrobiota bacterium]